MFNNKVVFITGASSGLGFELAKEAARRGAKLALSARRVERLQELREIVARESGREPLIVPCDVTKKDQVAKAIEATVNHFGALDHVIANAGQSMWCRFSDVADPEELNDLMQLNYMGVVYSAFYGLPHLRLSGGTFAAISSIQGVMPVAYHSGYVAAKYAVNGFVDTLRLEEPGVHFFLALPSWISGTELREHALAGHSANAVSVIKTHGKHAVSAADCARLILDAMAAKKDHLFIPRSYKLVPAVRLFLRRTVDKIVMHKVKGQLKS